MRRVNHKCLCWCVWRSQAIILSLPKHSYLLNLFHINPSSKFESFHLLYFSFLVRYVGALPAPPSSLHSSKPMLFCVHRSLSENARLETFNCCLNAIRFGADFHIARSSCNKCFKASRPTDCSNKNAYVTTIYGTRPFVWSIS